MGFEYSLSTISTIVGGQYIAQDDHDQLISEILIDSRKLVHPEGTLFVALVTDRNDGHRYIQDLLEKGVQNFLVSSLPDLPANYILVDNSLKALQDLAAYHRQQFQIPVVGITGSNGKTVVKEWLYHLLKEEHTIVRSPKSYNSQVGVPLSVLEMAPEHDLAIFEAGISMPNEMAQLERIIRPTIGVFTNIGQSHGENFSSERQKVEEKLRLFEEVNTLIYCADYPSIQTSIQNRFPKGATSLLNWGKADGVDLQILKIASIVGHTRISALYHHIQVDLEIPFSDDASIENAIHCWLVMLHLGYSQEVIADRMKDLEPIAMRLELKEAINHCSLINDSYSLDLNSLRVALDFMVQQNQHSRKTVILSDIFQTGKDPDKLYLEISQLLSGKGIQKIIGIGRQLKAHARYFPMEKSFYETTGDFLVHHPFSSFRDETILIKGARVFEFEKISVALQQKVHETVLEVNLDAMVHNLNYYRSQLTPGTKTMAMVKAFSYGSGSFEIANLLQFHHVDYLAVAYADEGVELRKAGITLPIMVMNPEEQSYDLLLQYHLEPEIYNLRTLIGLEKAIQSYNEPISGKVLVHIKVDTGMHRLGFEPTDLPALIERIRIHPLLKIQSVFSHLSASEDPQHDIFTRSQIERFRASCKAIEAGIGYPFIQHILNSAGIGRFPEAHLGMVRLGIGLYGVGYDDQEQSKLRNVSTLKSTISQIKKVPKGETVGYSRAGEVQRDSLIAIVPIGYADGLNRRLSKGVGKLFVAGRIAPIVGNICMDLCMIDVTDIPAKEGDSVIIFGEENPIANLARDLGTIPYEILTGISRRVKRVYFHE